MVGYHLTVNISSINYKDRPEYSTVETNDEYLENLSIQRDFGYYQPHNFHNFAMKLDKSNSFNAVRINICSLSANLENLELLLRNLDHAFDVIGVSENWGSENINNKNTMNNHTIPGYQNYVVQKAHPLKVIVDSLLK